jgi:glycosyltransferase involved in cell wall biosynthesis
MKILFVLDDGMTQTSAWVRALQYREALALRGVKAEFVSHRPVFLARLLAWLIRRGAPVRVRGLVKRLSWAIARLGEGRLARKARAFDVVYVLLVPSVSLYRRLHAIRPGGKTGPRVFMDVVDGLWLPSRRKVWKDLPEMLALADGVICENRFSAEYLRGHHRSVFVVPDSPQVEAFDARRALFRPSPDRVTLGWIGTPWACNALFAIFEPLERLFAKYPHLHLRVVGADPERIPRFEKVNWSLRRAYDHQGMVEEVLGMDIGLFPLFDTEESVMRGTLKAMVYMSGGAVAVCRRLGENVDLIRDGVNGVLADSPDEWFERLEALVLDAGRREALAAEGLRTVREGFSRERCLDSLLNAFQAA